MLLRVFSDLLKRPRNVASVAAEGAEHYARGDFVRAAQRFREAVRLVPDDLGARINLAVALRGQGDFRAAVPVLSMIVEMRPDFAEAHADLGVCYNRLRRNAEAISCFERAIALGPELHFPHASLVDAYLDICDWDAVERWKAAFLDYRSKHPRSDWAKRIEPFTALMLFPGEIAKEVAQQRAADLAAEVAAAQALPPQRSRAGTGRRIRVGYVSSDFYDHAIAHLTFRIFEAHDRDRFEVYAYSAGPDDGSAYRDHIARHCDRFADTRGETAEATARRIREDAIDILVDLGGYTARARPQVLALRPAPVQASYHYPGTMGAPFIDYFIGDAVAAPEGTDEFTECIVRLPGCYLVNDRDQPIVPTSPSRTEAGLPEGAFVYCSFNRLGKVDRAIFSAWMDILCAVPDSVLWLLREDASAERNLRDAARAAGVAEARIVFSDKVRKPEHLARHALADLFLDTTAYNAHTGASDALWAGLPVLTCPGNTFATRVAASLVHACGLPELAVADLTRYREAAIGYAREPQRLAVPHEKLRSARGTCPVFDTAAFVRGLESAYVHMHALRAAGKPPESFSIR
jgi:predicted O-linked N-acetylglucosamine transferase (SPINDLY family)